MRLVITGASGYIGKNLVNKLKIEKKNKLLLIVRSDKNISKLNKDNLNNNIFFLKASHKTKLSKFIESFHEFKPEVIIHLATAYLQDHNIYNLNDILDCNISFSTKIIEAAIKVNCTKFINTSTKWEFYNNKKIPVNLYAASKSAFNELLNYYHSAHKISIITIYLTDTYGEYDDRNKLIPFLIKNKNSKKNVNLTKGDQIIEYIHINDLLMIYHKIINKINFIDRPIKYAYFIHGERVSLKNLISIFKKTFNSKINFKLGALNYRNREVFNPYVGKSNFKLELKKKFNLKKFFKDFK